jgi:hypothetical protein
VNDVVSILLSCHSNNHLRLSMRRLIMWAAYVFAGRPTPVDPDAFRLVAALDDLSLMVPAMVCGGVLPWRRRPWAVVLAAMPASRARQLV